MNVLATYSIKGGVGKTSAAVNLAALAAREGRRTLIWDLDPQGAASYLFRVRPKVKGGGRKLVRGRRDPLSVVKATDVEGLDLLPADFSYRHLDLVLDQSKKPLRGVSRVLDPLAEHYDVAVLDCAPSISLVSENVFTAADRLLVPLVPSTLSVRTFEQLQAFLADGPQPAPGVVAFLSMVDRRRRLHREQAESLPETLPGVARAAVPGAPAGAVLGGARVPRLGHPPPRPAPRAYAELWAEIVAAISPSAA